MRLVAIFCSIVFVSMYINRQPILTFGEKLLDRGIASCAEIRQEEISFLSGNLELRGTLYSPACSFQKKAGIVLAHGATSFGRHLSMYSVMAPKLAKQGYVVLTFDFRGFGDSEDPHNLDIFSSLDFAHDIVSALTALAAVPMVDPTQLYIAGHSFGAGVALATGVRDARVKAIVSISPPRLAIERILSPDAPEPDFLSIRLSSSMELPQKIPRKYVEQYFKDYIPEKMLEYHVHPPILFVEGAREPQDELESLQKIYEQVSPPRDHIIIPEADHYFGTGFQQPYREDIVYNETVMNDLVDNIATWLQKLKHVAIPAYQIIDI